MSLFKEQTSGTVFNSSFDTVQFTDENQSNEIIRLNGGVDYNFLSDQTYFDLIVDDRFPNLVQAYHLVPKSPHPWLDYQSLTNHNIIYWEPIKIGLM